MIWVSKHPNLDYTDCSMLCVLLLTGYAAIMYIISATADFCPAGKIKHYFSMTDIPPSILILGNSVIICIDFSTFYTPPGYTVKIHTGTVEINLSTDDSPVSVFIGCKTVVVKINFSTGKSPPAMFIGRQTVIIEINLSSVDLPPSIFIGCKSVVIKIDLSSGQVPPAVFIGT